MPQRPWGSCTSLHPLLCMNEHRTIVCMNKAATAHRSIISSVSLIQYIISVFLSVFILLWDECRPHIHNVSCVLTITGVFPCVPVLASHTGHTHCMGTHSTYPSQAVYPTSYSEFISNCTMTGNDNEGGRILTLFSKGHNHTDGPRRIQSRALLNYRTMWHSQCTGPNLLRFFF